MTGGLMTFGDALKAFRRNVYTFPEEWQALVVCNSIAQMNFAFAEAGRILEAGSLKVLSHKPVERVIDVERGGKLYFRHEGQIDQGLMNGLRFPHIINVHNNLPERTRELLRVMQRHHSIEDRYFRFDEATL